MEVCEGFGWVSLRRDISLSLSNLSINLFLLT